MEQTNYSIEALVADESFQHYCTGRDEAAVQKWSSHFNQFPEQKPLEREARQIYLALCGNHHSNQYAKHLQLFQAKLALEEPQRRQTRFFSLAQRFNFQWTAAALILFVLSISIIIYYSRRHPANEQFMSKAGEKKTVSLPDGTTVVLNRSSTITIENDFGIKNRNIRLNGEAFFDVKHNSKLPFVVRTSQLIITDIGTKFNVRAYETDAVTEALLVEGIIEVATVTSPKKTLKLAPNQKIVYKNTIARAVDQTAEEEKLLVIPGITVNSGERLVGETDWMKDRLSFQDEEFEDIARKMERWYGIKIEFQDEQVKHYKFVGVFEKETFTEVLDFLRNSRPFQYRKEGNRITIY